MSSEFEQFTQAVNQQSRTDSTSSIDAVAASDCRVTVLGGGDDGRLLAALCLAENAQVTLFSAYGAELTAITQAGGITLRGEGPIGTFQVDQDGVPSIQLTAELDRAVEGADLVFLTGPVHKQRTYAMVLADHLVDGQALVIAPARSFGAIETHWLLRVGGCAADVTVVELAQLPYWHMNPSQSSPMQLSTVHSPIAATLPVARATDMARLRSLFPLIAPAQSVLDTSFLDASGIVEAVALLFGQSAINEQAPLPVGAVALPENRSLRALLASPQCQAMTACLLDERRSVAGRFGVRSLPDGEDWITRYAGQAKDAGRRSVPDVLQAQKLLRCAVTGSLVPLKSAASIAGVSTPATDALITIASTLLGADLPTSGRHLQNMGITAAALDDARAQLLRIAQGAC